MLSRGEFTIDGVTYGAIVSHTKIATEVILVLSGQVVSAYKTDVTGSYSYNNVRAKELAQFILSGAKGCTAKNGVPAPFELGAMTMHEFIKAKVEYLIQQYRGEIVGALIQSERVRIELTYCKENIIPEGIPYVKLTEVKRNKNIELTDDDLDSIPVRTVEEIALEKEDVSWLADKKYYVVNDDEVAEQLFTFLDNYDNVIAYDTETTGLRMNCFGKIGSSYMETLVKYNQEHPDEQIRADRLVGIIFCVEPNVSYYFPCFNRKFKNLYEDKNSPVRQKIIQNIRARYTLENVANLDEDMLKYIRSTADDDLRLDVLLMERVRNILTTKHIVAHNGTFEWKVGYQYGIDTNIKDDTMILHKIMYKFRSTTSNRGEPSDLKYLAKRELGMDQWELKDFFPNLKEDKDGTVRAKKGKKNSSGSRIDFSYMTYEGSRVYAPADGDTTLQLLFKYKRDLLTNHKEMIYIYEVELIVSMAIAYMEFYGHRLDESKIENAKNQTLINMALIESEIRQAIDYANDKELEAYNALKETREMIDKLSKATSAEDIAKREQLENSLMDSCDKLKQTINENTQQVINLSSPGQVANLFYDKLKYPLQGDKKSVAKNAIKALTKEKNEDGNPKYPVANMYSKYKAEETLLQKFFDNLPYFMYPGGFIFSSYGQIAAATGRMSCIAEDTNISTKYGYRKIQYMRPGDLVVTYNDLGELQVKKLVRVIDNGVKPCVKLTFKNDKRQETLVCTLDHKIRTTKGKWVKAIDITSDDEISGAVGKKCETFKLISILSVGNKHVYDLEVEDNHNFMASNICVHNCSKPNAQQYPKVITKIVYPREGYVMLDADYSQIEYRVLTAMAHNEDLAKMFSDPDSDYHTLMASLMYETPYASVTPKMRSSAKSFNFGIPYGMGFGSLAILLHGNRKQSSIDDAKEKYELYFKNQPRTRQFFDNVKEMAQIHGWTKTLFNRYRYYSFTDKDGNISNAKKAAALRQAGNAVIQGTAADIFKIGVARNFNYIRKNKLFGKLLIVNMIHDEQLMEVDTRSLNVQRVVTDACKNMQFSIDGFPPLFVGAGLGNAWGIAKSKMQEIDPRLLDELTKESDNMPIYKRPEDTEQSPQEILDYFDTRIHEFRRKKVYDYLSNPENWHKDIHPAIGSLINLQFNYGRGDEASAYTGPNGERYTDQEFLELNIGDFLVENGIPAEASWFKFNETMEEQKNDDEAEDEYDDSEEEEVDDILIESEETLGVFSQIDESNKLFGSSLQDMIGIFGCCVIAPKKLCGIDIRGYGFRQLDSIIDYIVNFACDPDDSEALRVVFLKEGNVLKYTDVYVKGIKASELETQYKQIKVAGNLSVQDKERTYDRG